MAESVPVSLFLTRRALCPGCGAPLQLETDSSRVTCDWCREESYVERRLRTVELEIEPGAERVARDTDFIPAHSIAASGKAETACPGCGGTVEITNEQDNATCGHCGSSAKVERRLVTGEQEQWDGAADEHDLEMFAGGQPRDFQKELYFDFSDLDEDARDAFLDEWNDQRVKQLLTADTFDKRFKHAIQIRAWKHHSPWRERMVARLMRLASDCEPELELAIAHRVVRDNLSSDDPEMQHAVFRAAGRALYSDNPSAEILRELGFAHAGAPFKLLLDLMEHALERGRVETAMQAMRGAAWSMDISYDRRFDYGEVLLYRMLYLKPPLLAFLLDQWHHWQIEDRYRILRFFDDAAIERPELIPLLRDRIGGQMWFDTFAKYRNYLKFVDELLTPLAKETALRLGQWSPEFEVKDRGFDDLKFALDFLHPLLDDPLFERTATNAVVRFVSRLQHQDLPTVHEFVTEHGDELPWRIRQEYLRQCPDTDALTPFEFRNTYEDEKEEPNDLQNAVAEWVRKFDEARRDIEDDRDQRVTAYQRLEERVSDELFEQEKQRKQEFARQEKQQEENERELHETEKQAAQEKLHDDWREDSIRTMRQQADEMRRNYEKYNDESYLRSAESIERQIETFRNTDHRKPRETLLSRLLRALMFWRR